MIVRPNKHFETNSEFPKSNFYTDQPNNIVVDETTEEGKKLAELVKANAPYFDMVFDINGKLSDIKPTAKPLTIVNAERKLAIDNRLAELDKTIPRGVEDLLAVLVVDETKLPTASMAKLTEKRALRTERSTLG